MKRFHRQTEGPGEDFALPLKFESLLPVLQLSRAALFTDQYPWADPLPPIPIVFPDWPSYLRSYIAPTLVNFRAEMWRMVREREQESIKFHERLLTKRIDWGQHPSRIVIAAPKSHFSAGDICLISQTNPDKQLRSAKSSPWDDCGWLIVDQVHRLPKASHDNDDPIMHFFCESFNFVAGRSAFIATIGSAVSANRVMASLGSSRSGMMRAALSQIVLQGRQSEYMTAMDHIVATNGIDDVLSGLNAAQAQAVNVAVRRYRSSCIGIIQGPPGTGKTTTIVALLAALFLESNRPLILQAAPTNIAVVEVATRLIERRPQWILPADIIIHVNEERVRKTMEISEQLRPYLLHTRVMATRALHESVIAALKTVTDLGMAAKELHYRACCTAILQATEQWRALAFDGIDDVLPSVTATVGRIELICATAAESACTDAEHRQAQCGIAALVSLIPREHRLHSQLAEFYLSRARIVFATLNGSKSALLQGRPFNVVVVDECAQAVEAEMAGLYQGALQGLVLVGDTRQLHGTVFSDECMVAGYQRSLFQRLADEHRFPVSMLTIQYRMHPTISAFPNQTFYNSRLINSDHVNNYERPWLAEERFQPLRFIAHDNTKHAIDMNGSAFNEEEAVLIVLEVAAFLRTHPMAPGRTVGVIAPYKAQKGILRAKLAALGDTITSKVDVNTVDGFQGQERDIIIISLTRTDRISSFLDQRERMNVAITRAKVGLWVFGDRRVFANTVGANGNASRRSPWLRFTRHCSTTGVMARSSQLDRDDDGKLVTRLVSETVAAAPSPAAAVQKLILARDYHLWRVVANEFVFDAMRLCTCEDTMQAFARVLTDLRMGKFGEARRPYAKSGGAAGALFFATKVARHFGLIWTIEIRDCRQVIHVLRHAAPSQIGDAWIAFKAGVEMVNPEYTAACHVRLVKGVAVAPLGNLHVPRTFFRAAASSSEASSVKMFELSDGHLVTAFTSARGADRVSFALPYLLDEHQENAIRALGSVVIIGRGGTGKTTVLAQRLYIAYRCALEHGIDPPGQLFVSQSGGLVRAIEREFLGLVDTFHRIHGGMQRRATHGCSFMSVLELMQSLDAQFGERLFRPVAGLGHTAIADNAPPPARRLCTPSDVVDFGRFKQTFLPLVSDALRRAFAPEFIFTEIMFVIKGGLERAMTRDEYASVLASAADVLVLSAQQRTAMYDAYEKYERSKAERGQVDYPDIARDILVRVGDARVPVDTIFLDEVQDLMPCHWRLLDLFRSRDTNVICSGDQAQSITAGNRFRFSALKAHLFVAGGDTGAKPTELHLSINYRTVAEVLQLANEVLRVLRFFFPDEIDSVPDEVSARGAPDLWSGRPKLFHEGAAKALAFVFQDCDELAAEQVFLVRDALTKDILLRHLDECGWRATVLTVLEAKGLEFEDVICYNLFSSMALGQAGAGRLRVLYNYARDANQQTALPSFEPRKHYDLMQALKELYVAVTRSKQRLVFIDDGLEERAVYVDLFVGLLDWTSIETEMSFSRTSTVDEWAMKAGQYEANGLLREARNAFLKAGRTTDQKRVEATILMREFEIGDGHDAALVVKASVLLKAIGRIEEAAVILEDARLFVEAAASYRLLDPVPIESVVACLQRAQPSVPHDLLAVLRQYRHQLGDVRVEKMLLRLAQEQLTLAATNISMYDIAIACLEGVHADWPGARTYFAPVLHAQHRLLRDHQCNGLTPASSLSLAAAPIQAVAALQCLIDQYIRWGDIDNGIAFLNSMGWKAAIHELITVSGHDQQCEKAREMVWQVRTAVCLETLRTQPALSAIPKLRLKAMPSSKPAPINIKNSKKAKAKEQKGKAKEQKAVVKDERAAGKCDEGHDSIEAFLVEAMASAVRSINVPRGVRDAIEANVAVWETGLCASDEGVVADDDDTRMAMLVVGLMLHASLIAFDKIESRFGNGAALDRADVEHARRELHERTMQFARAHVMSAWPLPAPIAVIIHDVANALLPGYLDMALECFQLIGQVNAIITDLIGAGSECDLLVALEKHSDWVAIADEHWARLSLHFFKSRDDDDDARALSIRCLAHIDHRSELFMSSRIAILTEILSARRGVAKESFSLACAIEEETAATLEDLHASMPHSDGREWEGAVSEGNLAMIDIVAKARMGALLHGIDSVSEGVDVSVLYKPLNDIVELVRSNGNSLVDVAALRWSDEMSAVPGAIVARVNILHLLVLHGVIELNMKSHIALVTVLAQDIIVAIGKLLQSSLGRHHLARSRHIDGPTAMETISAVRRFNQLVMTVPLSALVKESGGFVEVVAAIELERRGNLIEARAAYSRCDLKSDVEMMSSLIRAQFQSKKQQQSMRQH